VQAWVDGLSSTCSWTSSFQIALIGRCQVRHGRTLPELDEHRGRLVVNVVKHEVRVLPQAKEAVEEHGPGQEGCEGGGTNGAARGREQAGLHALRLHVLRDRMRAART